MRNLLGLTVSRFMRGHWAAAVTLDGPPGDSKVEADLLVELTADQMREHFALARCQPVESIARAELPRSKSAIRAVARDLRIEKHRFVDGLGTDMFLRDAKVCIAHAIKISASRGVTAQWHRFRPACRRS